MTNLSRQKNPDYNVGNSKMIEMLIPFECQTQAMNFAMFSAMSWCTKVNKHRVWKKGILACSLEMQLSKVAYSGQLLVYIFVI